MPMSALISMTPHRPCSQCQILETQEGLLSRWLRFSLLLPSLHCSSPGAVLRHSRQLHPVTLSQDRGGMGLGTTQGRTLSQVAPAGSVKL